MAAVIFLANMLGMDCQQREQGQNMSNPQSVATGVEYSGCDGSVFRNLFGIRLAFSQAETGSILSVGHRLRLPAVASLSLRWMAGVVARE